MAERPTNHVTEAMAANLRSSIVGTAVMPEVSKSLVDWLETHFPPRCLGKAETVEDHLRYAGMVELVTIIRARYEVAADWSPDALDDDDDGLPAGIEHA